MDNIKLSYRYHDYRMNKENKWKKLLPKSMILIIEDIIVNDYEKNLWWWYYIG